MNVIVRVLRRWARPFNLGHIHNHLDGELYMERFALFDWGFLACRLHHIVRADHDRHLHDHPWNFWSVLLSGSYIEERPITETGVWVGDTEVTYKTVRDTWSVAARTAFDRHKIMNVEGDVWTLFITTKYRNKWGFFTREGKVPYRVYLGLPPRDGVEP